MKKIRAGAAVVLLLAALTCFSGCSGDVSLFANPAMVITSYNYDDYLDPTRGENRDTFGQMIWLMVQNTKIRISLTIYMDGICTIAGNTYNGLNYNVNGETGKWTLYSGTMENGVIHVDGALYGSIGSTQVGGSSWYLQIVDGNRIISVAAPVNNYVLTSVSSTRAISAVSAAALTPKTASLEPVSLANDDEPQGMMSPGEFFGNVIVAGLEKEIKEKGIDALKPYMSEEAFAEASKKYNEWKAANPEEAAKLEKTEEE